MLKTVNAPATNNMAVLIKNIARPRPATGGRAPEKPMIPESAEITSKTKLHLNISTAPTVTPKTYATASASSFSDKRVQMPIKLASGLPQELPFSMSAVAGAAVNLFDRGVTGGVVNVDTARS